MRVRRLTTWLVLGIAVALAYAARRRRGAPWRRAVPTGVRGTPEEIDASTLGRGDLTDEEFVEAIAEWAPAADDDDSADEPLDEDHAEIEGEHWLEHLEARSAELGPEPERAIEPEHAIEDAGRPARHRRTATSDTPVADHGSGGPRGR
jgi:hypothetical protein